MINTAKIKGRMAEKGYTQKTLSDVVSISQSTLSLKLRNQRPMMLDEAEKLSAALSIQDSDFGEYFFCARNCAAQQKPA